jgi:hypothetical protein
MRGKGVTVSQLLLDSTLCDEARCDDVEEELACSTREFCADFAAEPRPEARRNDDTRSTAGSRASSGLNYSLAKSGST